MTCPIRRDCSKKEKFIGFTMQRFGPWGPDEPNHASHFFLHCSACPGQAEVGTTVMLGFGFGFLVFGGFFPTRPQLMLPGHREMVKRRLGSPSNGRLFLTRLLSNSQLPCTIRPHHDVPARPTSCVTCLSAAILSHGTEDKGIFPMNQQFHAVGQCNLT